MSTAGTREFDVIIIGAGIIGATMAGLLLKRGCSTPGRVALIADRFMQSPATGGGPEQGGPAVGRPADWDLRVFALSRASERLLQVCGIWDSLPRQRVNPYQRMRVWDAQGSSHGARSLQFDCADIGEPNLGHIVDGRVLQWQALEAARALGAVPLEAQLSAIVRGDDFISAVLGDGRSLRAKLIIGADGTESKTRQLLDIGAAGHAYHQDALVAHVSTEKPHGDTAWQRFLPGGPLALLPLPDGRSSLVWSMERAQAARLRALEPKDFSEALTAGSDAVLGRCTVTTPIAAFPLQLQYALAYVQSRAVLLGDAAHVVHPLAGQGLNLGLLDCAALAQVLVDCGNARSFGDLKTLRRYERWRRSENFLAGAALDGLERLFANDGILLSTARGVGMGAVQRLPMVKRALARRALGV
jgi:ubiquinone biosynthesis UbiH/UbiF/VisC/COQ6 family hydroxylase